MIVRTQTMHYQPDWLLEIGLHVYCSLLFLDSNSILAGGYSDCFLIKHLKWVDLNWKERNRSMTYQKLEWNRWSWNKNHFKKIHQKSCQNLMTTLLNPHLFFSQPGNIKKKILRDFFCQNPVCLRGHPLRWWCQLRHATQGCHLRKTAVEGDVMENSVDFPGS